MAGYCMSFSLFGYFPLMGPKGGTKLHKNRTRLSFAFLQCAQLESPQSGLDPTELLLSSGICTQANQTKEGVVNAELESY